MTLRNETHNVTKNEARKILLISISLILENINLYKDSHMCGSHEKILD